MSAARSFAQYLCRRRSGGERLLRIYCSRSVSSSAFADLPPVPEAVKESVKTSFLNEATREDSRLWQTNKETIRENGHHPSSGGRGAGVNDPINGLTDGLDDLYLQESLRYWPDLPANVEQSADPFQLAHSELSTLTQTIRDNLIATDHPVLNKAAAYFFDSSSAGDSGKKVRPMMVLLLSRALADSVSPAQSTPSGLFTTPLESQRSDLPEAQRRLAEISELIHTASLFHDDVIDGAHTRRGVPSVHMVFGNKMAILAGDYLLARASIFLARLRNVQVVETMSTIIEHLVRGEVMQMRGTNSQERSNDRIHYYLRKNFYKTGSLMANSCKSAALLGDYPPELVSASYRFGKHAGMAFQLVDDVLDFEGSLSQLGKPALSDLRAGLATAPVLFACEECGVELDPLVDRKFKQEGDVDRAVEIVFASNGIERSKELARLHAERAMDAILELEPSQHRDSLVRLANNIVARTM